MYFYQCLSNLTKWRTRDGRPSPPHLTVVADWCLIVGLRIKPTEPKLVYFSGSHHLDLRKIPTEKVVDRGKENKFLGITLERKLLWNKIVQVKLIVQKMCG